MSAGLSALEVRLVACFTALAHTGEALPVLRSLLVELDASGRCEHGAVESLLRRLGERFDDNPRVSGLHESLVAAVETAREARRRWADRRRVVESRMADDPCLCPPAA